MGTTRSVTANPANLFSRNEFYYWKEKCLADIRKAAKILNEPAGAAPELVSYPMGIVLTTPANIASAFKEYDSVAFSETANIGIAVGWNVFDGIVALITGVNLLLDEDNYLHTQNKIKGVVNIISGVQALVLSYNPALGMVLELGAAGFASPAFAFMALCDLVNASIDFYQASKEVDIDSWFDERIKEINFLDKKIKSLTDNNINHVHEERIKKLEQQRIEVINTFKIRSRCYCDEGPTTGLNRRQQIIKRKLNGIKNRDTFNTFFARNQGGGLFDKSTDKDKENNAAIQKDLVAAYEAKRTYLLMKGLSFTAMTLFALAPFAGPAAPALIIPAMVISYAVTGYYIYLHADELAMVFNSMLKFASHLFPVEYTAPTLQYK